MQIAITTTSFGKIDSSPLDYCRAKVGDVILNPYGRKLNADEVIEMVAGKDGMIAGTEILSRDVLRQLPGIRVISRLGAGIDNVDLEAAKEFGIKVYNTPFGPTRSVAELAVGLIFDLLRNISRSDREMRVGVWNKRMGNLLEGKKIGVIGFGRIGQLTANLLLPFAVEIAYFDLAEITADFHCQPMELNDLLAWADIATLHISASEPIIGKSELSFMKPDALLINLARGGAIDETALIESLKNSKLGGVALDVFEKEPYSGIFNEFENVLLTPHIGSYALEGRVAMEMQSVENLLKGLGLST